MGTPGNCPPCSPARSAGSACATSTWTASKWSTTEFVVLVADPRGGELVGLSEAILAGLSEPFEVPGHRLAISTSIGLVESDIAGTDPATLVKSAEVTLYWAKSDGRARWAMFDVERNAREMTRHTVLSTLAQGVAQRVPGAPPADHRPGRPAGSRGGSSGPVGSPDAGAPHSGPVHRTRRGQRHDRSVGPGRARRGLCRGGAMERRASRAAALRQRQLAARQAAEPDLAAVVAGILTESGLPPQRLHPGPAPTAHPEDRRRAGDRDPRRCGRGRGDRDQPGQAGP